MSDTIIPDSSDAEVVRTEQDKFAPGKSGNPGGRTKAVREAMKWMDLQVIPRVQEVIMATLAGDDAKEAATMARWAFEQRFGKAALVVTGEDGRPIDVTVGLYALFKKLMGDE